MPVPAPPTPPLEVTCAAPCVWAELPTWREGPRASWSSIPAQRSTAKQSACPRANGEPGFHEEDAVLAVDGRSRHAC